MINSKFDKIYCILNLDNKERIKNVQNVFNKYNINNVTYIYTFNKPIYKNVRNSYPSIITKFYDEYYEHDKNIYNKVFDVALNHYNIVKQSYKLGLNNILIIEDDLNIIVNKSVFEQIIESIPNNYDILKFHNGGDEHFLPITNKTNINWITHNDKLPFSFFSTIMVGYSRNGMKEYFSQIEKNGIAPSDIYFNNIYKKLNVYYLDSYFIKPILKSTILKSIIND